MEFNRKYIFNLTKDEWLKEINEALLKLDIQLCDSQGHYRSIYSLFDELSEKWHLLKENTDKGKANGYTTI